MVVWWTRTAAFLERTLESLAGQCCPPAEVLVVAEPGDLEERFELLRAYDDLLSIRPVARVGCAPNGTGPPQAFEAALDRRAIGLAEATQPWVLPLEEGDQLTPNALVMAMACAPDPPMGLVRLEVGWRAPNGRLLTAPTTEPTSALGHHKGVALHARDRLPKQFTLRVLHERLMWLGPAVLARRLEFEGGSVSVGDAEVTLTRTDEPWLDLPHGAEFALEETGRLLEQLGCNERDCSELLAAGKAALAARAEAHAREARLALLAAAGLLARGDLTTRALARVFEAAFSRV